MVTRSGIQPRAASQWYRGSCGKRIHLGPSAMILHGMTVQIAFCEGEHGPEDIVLCADRAQPLVEPHTGRLFPGRRDAYKIGKLSDDCAISCGGGGLHQNLFLARLLELPEALDDDTDYMDQLGRGALGEIDLCFDQALRRAKGVLADISERILSHQHPKLSVVLCGRDCGANLRICSWTADEAFRKLDTKWDQTLLILPAGLSEDQENALHALIRGKYGLKRAKAAVSHCATAVPIQVTRRFHYARMSEDFFIRSTAGESE